MKEQNIQTREINVIEFFTTCEKCGKEIKSYNLKGLEWNMKIHKDTHKKGGKKK